jgi:small GTP-binding protein
MTLFDDLLNRFPAEVREPVQMIWDTLEPGQRTSLLSLLSAFPTDSKMIRMLVRLSTSQVRQAFGRKRRVAIVGPTNVGKSTLYNQLVQNKKDIASVGPQPGTTKITQEANTALFSVVDTPGADAVGFGGKRERHLAMDAAEQADFLVLVFDAIQGIKVTEQELFNDLATLKKSYIVVLNKIDLVGHRDLEGVVNQAAQNLGLKPEQVIPLAAKDGKNLDKVLLAIAATEPEIVAALGQALPQYRWQLAWRAIVSAASVSAVIALAPLPIIDFIPLVFTQSVMVVTIARIYHYAITPKRAAELVTTFGIAFLGRTLFQELSKLGGVPGWLLSAAIASSTTVMMGYAAVRWFEKGERLSKEALNRLTKLVTDNLLGTLKGLGKRKPDRRGLQERIKISLEESELGESRDELDKKAGE